MSFQFRRWWSLAAALVPGAAFHVWFNLQASYPTAAGRQFTLFDDAMVSMTYARTLARTGELVWFPGAPRVEGFTNLLWTLYLAALHALGLSDSRAALAVILSNEVLLLAAAVLTYRLVLRLAGGSPLPALVAAGSLPLTYPLTFWSLRGMETGVIAVVCLILVLASDAALRAWRGGRRARQALAAVSAAGAVGVATRLDVALFAAAAVLCLLVWAPPQRRREVLMPAAAVAGVSIAVLAFQQAYYGDWLPNTYHLKMEGVAITDRLLRGLITEAKVLPLLCLGAWAVAALWRRSESVVRRLIVLTAGLVLAAVGYSVWVGGDAWEERLLVNRYQAVILPLLLALLLAGITSVAGQKMPVRRTRVAVAASVGVTGLGIGIFPSPLGYLVPLGPLVAAVLTVASLATLERLAGQTGRRRATTSALLLGAATFWLACSLVPTAASFSSELAAEDRAGTQLGQSIGQATDPDARVAVSAAGSIGYYAERPLVDLLGKSDRRIARGPVSRAPLAPTQYSPAFSTFTPGHNKWDFDYSLGELKPDVVTYLWGVDPDRIAAWGYEKACVGRFQVWVRTDSEKIDRGQLRPCALPTPGI